MSFYKEMLSRIKKRSEINIEEDSIIFERKTDSRRIVEDLIFIQKIMKNLLNAHDDRSGILQKARIEICKLGSSAGSATFEDIGKWQKPLIFLDKEVYNTADENQVLNTYRGIALHEGSHIRHTRKMYIRMQNKTLTGSRKLFEGLLEDERIEEKVLIESPGFAYYIEAAKRQLFKKNHTIKNWEEMPDSDKAFLILFNFLRLPHLINEEMKMWVTCSGANIFNILDSIFTFVPRTEDQIEYFGEQIEKVSQLIEWDTQALLENFYRGVDEDFEDFDYLSPLTREELDKRRNRQLEAKKEDEIDEYKFDALKKLIENTVSKLPFEDTDDIIEGIKNGDIKEYEKIGGDIEAIKSKIQEIEEKRSDRFSIKDIERLIEPDKTYSLTAKETEELAQIEQEEIEEGEMWVSEEGGIPRKTIVTFPKPDVLENKERYNQLHQKVIKHVGRMREIFQLRLGDQKRISTEQTEGKLHKRSLGKALISDKLFSQTYTKITQGLSIGLLLDESGSMDSVYPGSINPATTTAKTAITIAEALKGIPKIELEVYSHTSCGTHHENCMIKYLYGKRNKKIAGIGGYSGGHQNYDHVAIKKAAQLLKENTTYKKRILLVISDGEPAGYKYGGTSAINQTKQIIKDLERENIYVIGIAVAGFRIESMYKHYIKMNDISQLINEMRILLTKIISN